MIHQPGTGKLEDKYLGPYTVLDALSSVNFRIQMNKNKRPLVVHHDRLKPYYARNPEENDTSWIYDLPGYQKPANTNRINVPCIPTCPSRREMSTCQVHRRRTQLWSDAITHEARDEIMKDG